MRNMHPCVDWPDSKMFPIGHPMQENHYFVEYMWFALIEKNREGLAREGLLET